MTSVATSAPSPAHSLSRRELLCGTAAVGALALATPRIAQNAAIDPADLTPLIDEISDLVLPGSRVARPGAFIASVLPSRWRGLTVDDVQRVGRWLDQAVQGQFLRRDLAQRYAALASLDAAAFGRAPAASRAVDAETGQSWQTLKRAVLTAWYTSEQGGAGDLAFQLVPGRWDPDLPIGNHPHPLSNDWLAIWFS